MAAEAVIPYQTVVVIKQCQPNKENVIEIEMQVRYDLHYPHQYCLHRIQMVKAPMQLLDKSKMGVDERKNDR